MVLHQPFLRVLRAVKWVGAGLSFASSSHHTAFAGGARTGWEGNLRMAYLEAQDDHLGSMFLPPGPPPNPRELRKQNVPQLSCQSRCRPLPSCLFAAPGQEEGMGPGLTN